MLIIGVGYFCAGIFPPDPKWFAGGLLHGIGGLVVIFGSPMVFTLVSKGFARNEASATAARPLIWTAALTWLSLSLFCGSIIAFGGAPRSDGIVVGWTNLILITSFVLWFLVAAFHVDAEADKQLFEAALTAAARSVALPRLLSAGHVRTSAFGGKADMAIALRNVRF